MILKWLPALTIMTILFIGSSTPGQTIDSVGLGWEPIQIATHFTLYTLLCLSFYLPLRNIVAAPAFTLFYGVFDEIHQILTPLRSPSLFDIKIDALGAITGVLIIWSINLFQKKIHKI